MARPGQIGIGCFSAAGRGVLGPASVCGSSGCPPSPLRRTVRVDFARRDLSGKITHPSGPKARKVSRAAAMQETADWLEKLGMSEYAPRFAENGIDFGVLSDLTDQDLKEIGVLLGHRRKLLRAIADLGSASAAEHVPPPASAAPVAALTSALTEAAGERRHATVMFCDLVDSNGIASKLYAEKWHDLVGFSLNAASAVVTEMGGKVSKELGDGLIALFGYQVPQENDADDKIICRRLMTGE